MGGDVPRHAPEEARRKEEGGREETRREEGGDEEARREEGVTEVT